MLGPEGVLDVVSAFAADAVPARCAAILAALGDETIKSFEPQTYAAFEVPDVNAIPKFPALLVVLIDVPEMRWVDDEDGVTSQFLTDYRLQLHTLYRADVMPTMQSRAHEIAELGRNRLWRATAEAFLLDPSLGGGPVSLSGRKVTGAFHTYEKDSQSRIVGSAHIDVRVKALESLDATPLAPASDVDVLDVEVDTEPLSP